ncbi:hypothetical protein PIB30_100723, partial [Stylosanthes scabra]|nr:hypothetical protein [Stylosanthes scabra]
MATEDWDTTALNADTSEATMVRRRCCKVDGDGMRWGWLGHGAETTAAETSSTFKMATRDFDAMLRRRRQRWWDEMWTGSDAAVWQDRVGG